MHFTFTVAKIFAFVKHRAIDQNFKHLTTDGGNEKEKEKELSKCSHELEMKLYELNSLKVLKPLFEVVNGEQHLRQWSHMFVKYNGLLTNEMEALREEGRNDELRNCLLVAQSLVCLDRFCCAEVEDFASRGFGFLNRNYRIELNREVREAYRNILDHIKNFDYMSASLLLTEIDESTLSASHKNQISLMLRYSLMRLIRETKTNAVWLDGRIECDENGHEIEKIKDNVNKARECLVHVKLVSMLDDEMKKQLDTFAREIDAMLSASIVKGLDSIEAFMNADSFFEAEQGMQTLNRIQKGKQLE